MAKSQVNKKKVNFSKKAKDAYVLNKAMQGLSIKKKEKTLAKVKPLPIATAKVEANPYLESLLDPFNTDGAKIPDDQCYPSAVFSLTKKIAMTANSAGIAGICVGQVRGAIASSVTAGSLVPMNWSTTANAYLLGQQTVPGSTAANLFLTTGGTNEGAFSWDQWAPVAGSNAVQTAFDQCRLVSMGLAVSYTGAPLGAKGRITLAYTPKNQLGQDVAISVDRLQACVGSKVIPINDFEGAIALYKPVDYDNWNYKSLTTFHDLGNSIERDEYADGTLWIVADGLEFISVGNAATLQFLLIAHYEGIPKRANWSLIDPEPSEHDPLMLASAMNIVQEAPTTVGTAAPAIKGVFEAPVQHMKIRKGGKQKKSSLLTQFEGGVKRALQFGAEVAPLARMIMGG